MLKDIIPSPHAKHKAHCVPRISKTKDDRRVKEEQNTKKRKSTGGVSAEAGPSRRRLETTAVSGEDEIRVLDTPSKKPKIHTVDLTTGRKPVFINLMDSDSEDEKPAIVL